MQSFDEINKSHENVDQWNYKTNPDDLIRKNKIIEACNRLGPFERCLDIGACEGWITQDLPAKYVYGYECSENARNRFPSTVINAWPKPVGGFDLVVATGVMYRHYNWKDFLTLVKDRCTNIFVTCNIHDWEIPELKGEGLGEFLNGKQLFEEEFKYREYVQKLRAFRI